MIRIIVAALLASLLFGCAGRSFQEARREDTAAAYHRFLRDHGRSSLAEEARQRLELARIRSNPSVGAYDAFRSRWPESLLLAELAAAVEEPIFEQARARGTTEAYREFLAEFGSGSLAARARGNLAYLEASGFGADPARLAAFATDHPASDYAPEAGRSARAPELRGRSGFRRVGLVVQISAETPGRDRLARAFADRARESLERIGVKLVPLPAGDDPQAEVLPARLEIRHREGSVASKLEDGAVAAAGVLADTRVSLSLAGAERPIWSRSIQYRAPAPSQLADTSILFSPGSDSYWHSFFVPLASWDTAAAVRRPVSFDARAVAVEAFGDRGIVLLEDGSFRIFDLGNPERPWPLASYDRPRDLAHFQGVRGFDDRIVIYGEDGVEIVALGPEGPRLERALDRGAIGSVGAAELMGEVVIAASQRGLVLVPSDGEPNVLVPRPIGGLARVGDHLIFTSGNSIFTSTLVQLADGRVAAELPLGPGVEPGAIRVSADGVGVVRTQRGALRLDLARPDSPRLLSRIDERETGRLQDAVVARSRLFLLGERGLQLADPRGDRVVESADVVARGRIDVMGRHLVLVGDSWLQVVDTTPFVARVPTANAADAAVDGRSSE